MDVVVGVLVLREQPVHGSSPPGGCCSPDASLLAVDHTGAPPVPRVCNLAVPRIPFMSSVFFGLQECRRAASRHHVCCGGCG